jgi:hypothetical protein
VYRTADPVPPKQWRLGAASGIGVFRDTERETSVPSVPLVLSARRGIGQDLDVGARIYTSGMQLSATWRVHHATWSLALAPSIGGARLLESAVTVDSINLFAGLQGIASRAISKRWTIAMGPTSGWGLYYPETGGHAQGVWLGAFVLAEAKLGSRWRIGPELGGYGVVSGQVPVQGRYFQLAGNVKLDL